MAATPLHSSKLDEFSLERAFPDISTLLQPATVPNANANDVLVVLDTNALMVPLSLDNKTGLPAIKGALTKLISAGKLFIPARALREFAKNRDQNLAEQVRSVFNQMSELGPKSISLPPLVHDLPKGQRATEAQEHFAEARKKYRDAVEDLVTEMKSWRGSDPVSTMYKEMFPPWSVVELSDQLDADELAKDWAQRLKLKVPPGYKDGGKTDKGIGDYLIWRTILQLGEQHKKDLIFVTGDSKADWFVSQEKERIYPRAELLQEYKSASSGRSINLSSLADILREIEASNELVDEVRQVEAAANSQSSTLATNYPWNPNENTTSFDFTTNDGIVTLRDGIRSVQVGFSSSGGTSLHLYKLDPQTPKIARVGRVPSGRPIEIGSIDTSSRSYRVFLNEVFVAWNANGDALVARIISINATGHGSLFDNVTFTWRIFEAGRTLIAP